MLSRVVLPSPLGGEGSGVRGSFPCIGRPSPPAPLPQGERGARNRTPSAGLGRRAASRLLPPEKKTPSPQVRAGCPQESEAVGWLLPARHLMYLVDQVGADLDGDGDRGLLAADLQAV